MIYTIGYKANYLKAIADSPDGKIFKTGRRDPCRKFPDGYAGGYAFKTIEDAQRRIDEAYSGKGYAVFGLFAKWEKDTVPSLCGWWHGLLRDAEIVVL